MKKGVKLMPITKARSKHNRAMREIKRRRALNALKDIERKLKQIRQK